MSELLYKLRAQMLLHMIRDSCAFNDEAMTGSLACDDVDSVLTRLQYFATQQPDEALKKDAKLMLGWFLDTKQ